MNNTQIKTLSREQLSGKWLILAGVNIAAFLLSFIVYWFINEFLWILVAIPAVYAIKQLCFDIASGEEEINFNDISFNVNSCIGIYVYRLFIKVVDRIYILIKIIFGILVFKKIITGVAGEFMDSFKGMDLLSMAMDGPSEMEIINGIISSIKSLVFAVILFEIVFLAVYLIVVYIRSIYFFTEYILMMEEDKNILEVMKKSRMLMKGHVKEFILFELSFIGWYALSIVSFGIGFAFLSSYMKVANTHFYMRILNEKGMVEKKKIKISKDEYTEFRAWMDETKAREEMEV